MIDAYVFCLIILISVQNQLNWDLNDLNRKLIISKKSLIYCVELAIEWDELGFPDCNHISIILSNLIFNSKLR